MITSLTNSKVKYVRRLQSESRFRQAEGMFVVEGTRWLQELVQRGLPAAFVLCTPTWQTQAGEVALPGPAWVVSEEVMAEVSDVTTPPGVLVVASTPQLAWPTRLTWALILDNVRNPGNLGTILRAAAGAGVEGVWLSPGCVDAYNPKVLRGAMGAHLRLPLERLEWAGIAKGARGLAVWLAAADGERIYTEVDWRQPSALIIGSEAEGGGQEAARLATGRAAIPLAAATESLNAALAAGIILFEGARQRRGDATTLGSVT